MFNILKNKVVYGRFGTYFAEILVYKLPEDVEFTIKIYKFEERNKLFRRALFKDGFYLSEITIKKAVHAAVWEIEKLDWRLYEVDEWDGIVPRPVFMGNHEVLTKVDYEIEEFKPTIKEWDENINYEEEEYIN